jgi:hypothetical protein
MERATFRASGGEALPWHVRRGSIWDADVPLRTVTEKQMQGRFLVLLGVLAVAPASAQPFRFPLQPQPQEQAPPPPSSPPVAPPEAGPSLPPSRGFAAQPTEVAPGQQEEEAYQAPAPDRQSAAPPR